MREQEREREREGEREREKEREGEREFCLFVFLTSSSATRLYRGRFPRDRAGKQ